MDQLIPLIKVKVVTSVGDIYNAPSEQKDYNGKSRTRKQATNAQLIHLCGFLI
jgi:hypothetical protein